MANKCPKPLGNTGLSGIYAIKKNVTATCNIYFVKRNSYKWVSSKERSVA